MTSDKTTSNTRNEAAANSPGAKARAAKRIATASALPQAPKAPGKPGAVRPCVCGCGATTGGLFAPGHDARLHAWERAIAADAKLAAPKAVVDALARWHAAKTQQATAKAASKATRDAAKAAKAAKAAAPKAAKPAKA